MPVVYAAQANEQEIAQAGSQPLWGLPRGNLGGRVANEFLRSDAGTTGISTGSYTPQGLDEMRNAVQAGSLIPLNDAARNIAKMGGFREGDITPLGALQGGLPGGLSTEYWRVVIEKADTEAKNALSRSIAAGYFGSTPPKIVTDPQTGVTFFDLNDPTLTLEARQQAANIMNQAAQTTIASRLADNTIRQTDLDEAFRRDQLALDARKQLFTEADRLADLNANPRTRIQASFLGDTRGGLGPDAANAQAGSLDFQAAMNFLPGTGKPGGPDHYATVNSPDGSTVHYFGTPVQTPDGVANVPVGAFSRALMGGVKVPTAGNIATTGGYATAQQVRQDFDLNNVRLADFLKGSRPEQQEFLGVSSFAGNDDQTTTDTLDRFTPKQRGVFGGTRYS